MWIQTCGVKHLETSIISYFVKQFLALFKPGQRNPNTTWQVRGTFWNMVRGQLWILLCTKCTRRMLSVYQERGRALSVLWGGDIWWNCICASSCYLYPKILPSDTISVLSLVHTVFLRLLVKTRCLWFPWKIRFCLNTSTLMTKSAAEIFTFRVAWIFPS